MDGEMIAMLFKIVGLALAAACLTVGLNRAAEAQGLPAGAVALTPGNYLTLDNTKITITQIVGCSDGTGNTCSNMYMAPTSGPGASIIIEAATGSAPGSTLEPLFTCSPTTTLCTAGGTYDLTVDLSVQEVGTGKFTGVSGSIAGTANPSSLNSDVTLGETVTANFTTVCNQSVTLSSPSFACNFSSTPETSLSVTKDLGLSLTGVTSGSTLTLNSVTQSFTPAPEPASVATLLAGIAALAATRRTRRRT
jgi:hypothetical protein